MEKGKGCKIKKAEEVLSIALDYPVWLIKRHGGYEVQKIENGEFLMNGVDDFLWFKNLRAVKEYAQELEESSK